MFDWDDILALVMLVGVIGIMAFIGCGGRLGGKAAAYEEVCQKACPTQTAQVIEGLTERVCMCGTKLEGTLVLELHTRE